MSILLDGLYTCPISFRQLRSLNHVVVSLEIAAECIKCSELATSLRQWPRVKTDLLRDTCHTAVLSVITHVGIVSAVCLSVCPRSKRNNGLSYQHQTWCTYTL